MPIKTPKKFTVVRPLKVYAGPDWAVHLKRWPYNKTAHLIVAARSGAEVKRITGVGSSTFRNYWGQTHEPCAVDAALAQPGIVLIEIDRGKYKPLALVMKGNRR